MPEIRRIIVTDLGRKDLIKAQAEDRAVNWNTLCVGDGGGSVPPLNPQATRLVNELWSGRLINKVVDPDNESLISLHGVVPSDVGDFWIREAGIKNDNNELVLVAETNVFEKLSHETTGVVSELELYFDLTVSNAEIIQVNVDNSTVYVTTKDLQNMRKELENYVHVEIDEYLTMQETDKEDVEEVFQMTGSGSEDPYPADWVEASDEDIDSLFS